MKKEIKLASANCKSLSQEKNIWNLEFFISIQTWGNYKNVLEQKRSSKKFNKIRSF